MLLAHRRNADGVAILSFAVVAAAILVWRKHRAPGVLVLCTAALSAAVVGQIATGYNRILGLHVPLGVAVIVLSTVLTVWAWRRAA
jgi:heme A synthase